MILIDHQVGTLNFAKSIARDQIEANTRALARAAVALGMPIVFTSSMEDHQQGPLLPALEAIAPDAFAARVKRPGVVNCWDDNAFAEACRKTGRTQFIMAGVTTDVCLAPPAFSAAAEGYRVTAVVDASGSRRRHYQPDNRHWLARWAEKPGRSCRIGHSDHGEAPVTVGGALAGV